MSHPYLGKWVKGKLPNGKEVIGILEFDPLLGVEFVLSEDKRIGYVLNEWQISNNPMSQKYPEGAIIVNGRSKRKILGAAGEVRFVSVPGDYDRYDTTINVVFIEEGGWTVEETPWRPEEGEKFEFVNDSGCTNIDIYNKKTPWMVAAVNAGNCYRPLSKEAQAAAERVRKAYKNE